jgi:hypothetical protein
MRVLLSGASGLIGKQLGPVLKAKGHEVWGLSRKPQAATDAVARWFAWDSMKGPLPEGALEGVDAVIHLAGEPVIDGRWTDARKHELIESRRLGTRHVVQSLAACAPERRPRALLSASAVGYYGNTGASWVDESSPAGKGFLAEICVAWEEEALKAEPLGVRVVRHRIGLVMTPEGGALSKMLLPFKLGLGGRLGDGNQYQPWIHLKDTLGLLLHALEHEGVTGALNTVAPEPVTNREFTRVLGHVLHRPTVAAVPVFALKLAMGEAAEAVLDGQRVSAKKAEDAGYVFQFRTLEPCLRDVLGK